MADFAGKPINIPDVEETLIRLCGEGRYQSADYGFVLDEYQNPVLEIRITQKTYAPPTSTLDLILAGSDVAILILVLVHDLTFFDIGSYGSEWRNDANLGFQSFFQTEFYRPFGRRGLMSQFGLFQRGFFFAPRAFYERGIRNFFSGGERVAEYEVNNYGLGGDVGYETWKTELRAGYVLEGLDANLSTGVAPITQLKGKVDFPRVRFEYEGANSATIPTQGVAAFIRKFVTTWMRLKKRNSSRGFLLRVPGTNRSAQKELFSQQRSSVLRLIKKPPRLKNLRWEVLSI